MAKDFVLVLCLVTVEYRFTQPELLCFVYPPSASNNKKQNKNTKIIKCTFICNLFTKKINTGHT